MLLSCNVRTSTADDVCHLSFVFWGRLERRHEALQLYMWKNTRKTKLQENSTRSAQHGGSQKGEEAAGSKSWSIEQLLGRRFRAGSAYPSWWVHPRTCLHVDVSTATSSKQGSTASAESGMLSWEKYEVRRAPSRFNAVPELDITCEFQHNSHIF